MYAYIYMDLYGVFGVDVVGPSSFFRIRKSAGTPTEPPAWLGACWGLL